MRVAVSPHNLTKRFPLTISRGTSAGSSNLVVAIEHEGLTGIGEAAPFYVGHGGDDATVLSARLEEWAALLADTAPWEMQRIEAILDDQAECDGSEGIEAHRPASAARAALDMACHDWLGKKTGLPVYRLLGLDPEAIVPTSLTIGINSPDIVRERVPEMLSRLAPKLLKIKLGSPDGIEADRAMFSVVRELTPPHVGLRVDANGGWSVEDARFMIRWLAEQGVEYVEQPLPAGDEDFLPLIYSSAPIPIIADESCSCAADVPGLADRVHGVNLKLMKSGGIREGLRVIHTARAHGLKVMMGCMGESSLSIAASAHLSPLADYLDLDSHLNLLPDPFTGLHWHDGRVLPGDAPGLGVQLAEETASVSALV
jgi:L-Ala-D/L-Glu epimerase